MRLLFSKRIAFISKPRCGSSSLRRMLDPLVVPDAGDIAVDVAGRRPPFHPHMTAPYLQELLRTNYPEAPDLEYFVTTRHPVEMLFSYYKYFQPDEHGRYNYQDAWAGRIGPSFEKWILEGRVGVNPEWLRLAPSNISPHDLSPLSLEAHGMDESGHLVVQQVFRIEEPEKIRAWLNEKAGREVSLPHINSTDKTSPPAIGVNALDKIREMLPLESEIYAI